MEPLVRRDNEENQLFTKSTVITEQEQEQKRNTPPPYCWNYARHMKNIMKADS